MVKLLPWDVMLPWNQILPQNHVLSWDALYQSYLCCLVNAWAILCSPCSAQIKLKQGCIGKQMLGWDPRYQQICCGWYQWDACMYLYISLMNWSVFLIFSKNAKSLKSNDLIIGWKVSPSFDVVMGWLKEAVFPTPLDAVGPNPNSGSPLDGYGGALAFVLGWESCVWFPLSVNWLLICSSP